MKETKMSKDTGTQTLGYFSKKCISNSLMGIYESDFANFSGYWAEDKPLKRKLSYGLTLGTVVDTLLTREKEAHKILKVGKVPTGQVLTYIHELAKTPDCNHTIAYAALEAQNGGSVRSSVDYFKSKFEEYSSYYDSITNSGIVLVDSYTMNVANKRVSELRSNPFTRTLTNVRTTGEIEVFYQVEIYADIKGIPCKGALDKVVVDNKNKTVTLIDFKTSSNYANFDESVVRYNYWRQGSFYTHLIKFWMEDKGIQDYKINSFYFVIISTSVPDAHFVAKLGQDDIEKGRKGGVLQSGKRVKGWEEILDEIKYMTEVGTFKYPYDILKNKGVKYLKVFK